MGAPTCMHAHTQDVNMAEDGNSCHGPLKICKIAIYSVPIPQPHLPDMTFHPDDIVELFVVGQETEFASPTEDIDKSAGVMQQDLGKANAQQKGLVIELHERLVDMEKRLRTERE